MRANGAQAVSTSPVIGGFLHALSRLDRSPARWDDPGVTELPDDVRALFEGANYAHLATVLPSGAPHSVPVWTGIEGDHVVFFTQPASRKARNLARDPRVAFSITDHEHPYRMAQVRGRVVETVEGDAALEIIDRLAVKYTGGAVPDALRRGLPDRALEGAAMTLPFEHAPA